MKKAQENLIILALEAFFFSALSILLRQADWGPESLKKAK